MSHFRDLIQQWQGNEILRRYFICRSGITTTTALKRVDKCAPPNQTAHKVAAEKCYSQLAITDLLIGWQPRPIKKGWKLEKKECNYMSLPFVGRFGVINDYVGMMETRVMKIRLEETRPKQHVEKRSLKFENVLRCNLVILFSTI